MNSQQLYTMAPPLVPKPAFLGVIWAGTAVGTAALAFRFYVRSKYFHRLLIDDFFAGFAWMLLLSTAIIWTVIMDDVYDIKYVLSHEKMPDLGFLHSLEQYLHGSLAVLLMFYLGLWAIKINFLIFFRRLGNQVTNFAVYWWIVTLFTVATGAVCIGTIQYQCLGSVESSIAQCSKPDAIKFEEVTLKVNCALDVFTDALIMSMPISILWKVRITLGRKLQLAGIFSLVLITMVVAIIRVTVVSNKGDPLNHNQVEITWLYLWHFIESSIALLVACLASFRTLFAAKDRRAEEEEQNYREQVLRESASKRSKTKLMMIRAKYFQDTLFNSVKTTDGTTKVDSYISDGMEHPLRSLNHE